MAYLETYSTAWQQFLLAKRALLAEYDRALVHARSQPVITHHGIVGEEAIRDWLGTFLPKRFGVTSGYIRSQGMPEAYMSSHFDVIIYNQLNAPTLWIEENRGKAETGKARIIPAEHVGAIFEVKAAFSRRTVDESIGKLRQLAPLVAGVDAANERYPKYLPANTVLGVMFFELRKDERKDLAALELFRCLNLGRQFYGGVILRGDGLHPDDTARIELTVGNEPIEAIFNDAGLLHSLTLSGTVEVAGQHWGTILMWSDINISRFAFDLLALLNGTYQSGRASSFHGYDLGKVMHRD
jgi:hypothetical protein